MEPLLVSLLAATEAAPTDIPLRLHLADLLRADGKPEEAVRHCAAALAIDPGSENARRLMRDLLGVPAGQAQQTGAMPPAGADQDTAAVERASGEGDEPGSSRTRPQHGAGPDQGTHGAAAEPDQGRDAAGASHAPDDVDDRDDLWAERVNVTLADIGGMDVAKERLEAAVLAPMRNPELRRLYRKSRSGGVLLYGPPGCGKTFLARATAGELDARFLAVTFAGMSHEEQTDEIAAVFHAAREQAPVVLCLNGIDHLGERAATRRATSGAVAALVAELDRGSEGNYGITIMGSTNAPWNVDPVLRRPGRLEQSLLVLPPDRTTREVVLRQQLGEHPEVDVAEIAHLSSGYSGSDIAAAVRTAESRVSPVTTDDVLDALLERVPSAREWLERAARELSADPDPGSFVGLREYITMVAGRTH